jgi:hypothetical protein
MENQQVKDRIIIGSDDHKKFLDTLEKTGRGGKNLCAICWAQISNNQKPMHELNTNHKDHIFTPSQYNSWDKILPIITKYNKWVEFEKSYKDVLPGPPVTTQKRKNNDITEELNHFVNVFFIIGTRREKFIKK